jgi:phytoene dehydrogenase-like protein
MSRVVVIGAGFGGIAAALRARAKGHDVTLVDRCARLGGRAQVFEKDGFRHDAGPTVLTAPFLFEELFALFGKDIADYVSIVPLPLWYRFHFHDGETFDYGGGIEQTLAEITRIHPPRSPTRRSIASSSCSGRCHSCSAWARTVRCGRWCRGASRTTRSVRPSPSSPCWWAAIPSTPPASTG